MNRKRCAVALTIAGSDSGGGAGIQADLRTFAAVGVHGTSAITCLTAQNPGRITRVEPVPAAAVAAQIRAVVEGFRPAAVKTGMLFDRAVILAVTRCLSGLPGVPVIVDPVMVATSGARLLRPEALRCLCDRLLPLGSLLTPNLAEAEVLVGRSVEDRSAMEAAAVTLHNRYGCAVLLKGGHRLDRGRATDIFWDGSRLEVLHARAVRGVGTHGTGCTLSAAIAAYCAQGYLMVDAAKRAKRLISGAIRHAWKCGAHDVLNPFWGFSRLRQETLRVSPKSPTYLRGP